MARFQFVRERTGLLRWRLLAANNRVVALAPAVVEQVAEAVTEVARVRDAVARRRAELVLDRRAGGWRWVVGDTTGVPVARSSRAYGRRVDCDHALQRFLDTVVDATVDPQVLVVGSGPTPH